MKTLILLSKQFPFGNKEQYIAHELNYLSKTFDRIVIYPHDHFKANDTISFPLPANCEVADLNQHIAKSSRLWPTMVFVWVFIRELFLVKHKTWWLRNARKFYGIWLTQWSLSNGLNRYLKANVTKDEQVVFYSYWFSMSAICLSMLKSRNLISGYVSRAHALDLYHEDWKSPNAQIFSLPFRFFKQRHVTMLYPISEHGKAYMQRFMNAQKLQRRYLGVFDMGLNPERGANDEFVVVSCSGVDERKRIHLIGQALSQLEGKVRWIHFGDGPLKQQAIESVAGSQVIFEYKGQTPNKEIREFYRREHVDVFVNVSMSEGLPVAIMESVSHGVPAIGVKDYGTSEIVIDGYTGKLLQPDFSIADLTDALRFMKDSSDVLRYRANARKHFQDYFNAAQNYMDFAQELAELAD